MKTILSHDMFGTPIHLGDKVIVTGMYSKPNNGHGVIVRATDANIWVSMGNSKKDSKPTQHKIELGKMLRFISAEVDIKEVDTNYLPNKLAKLQETADSLRETKTINKTPKYALVFLGHSYSDIPTSVRPENSHPLDSSYEGLISSVHKPIIDKFDKFLAKLVNVDNPKDFKRLQAYSWSKTGGLGVYNTWSSTHREIPESKVNKILGKGTFLDGKDHTISTKKEMASIVNWMVKEYRESAIGGVGQIWSIDRDTPSTCKCNIDRSYQYLTPKYIKDIVDIEQYVKLTTTKLEVTRGMYCDQGILDAMSKILNRACKHADPKSWHRTPEKMVAMVSGVRDHLSKKYPDLKLNLGPLDDILLIHTV